MQRGEIWRVRLPFTGGHEQGGERSAVIVQDEPATEKLPTVLVAPFTSVSGTSRFQGTTVVQPKPQNGLTEPSVLLVFQMRAVDRRSFLWRMGALNPDTLQQLFSLFDSLTAQRRLSVNCIATLKTRRSVRVYQDKPITKEALEEIVDCGRLAPTAINIQPWEFVVVTEKASLQKIADLTDHGKFIAAAAACVAVFCNDTKYYLEDGCAATMNILNAAHALGLGGCWVAGDKKPYCDEVRRLLGLPDSQKLISLLALGYPAEQPTKEKRPLGDVLHWEKYGSK